MSTTDQVTAMCQQMSMELAFLTNSTSNDEFSEKFKLNDSRSIGNIILKIYFLTLSENNKIHNKAQIFIFLKHRKYKIKQIILI